MASRCTHCGGELRYDISSAKVKCLHCDSSYAPEEFQIKTAAEETENPTIDVENAKNSYEATIFVCPNCGAEIYTTEFDAVNYCMYCGSMVTLESNLARVRKPDLIIPFSKTMEECKAAYKSFVRWKLYAPSEFRDASFMEGFKGIYIPFWNYEYAYGPTLKIKGKDENQKGNYLYTTHYVSTCNASGHIDNVVYDASSNFDDEISLRIAPYKREQMQKFSPAYMFGFFGDTADIAKTIYSKESDELVKAQLWESVAQDKKLSSGYVNSDCPETMEKDFNLKKKVSLAMLPVWFLTWRKGDRLAYSVMNGATGNLYAEIPVSIGRYLMFSLLSAIPIYFLLDQAYTFTARNLLVMAMALSGFMIMFYSFELDKIVRRVMHTDDRGFLETHEDAKQVSDAKVSDNFITDIWDCLCELKLTEWLMFIVVFLAIICCQLEAFVVFVLFSVFAIPIYILWRLWNNITILKDTSIVFDILGAIFAIVFSVGLLIYDPAPDLYYYVSALICMLGVGLAAIGMVRRYNQLITRPVPRFFNRKAGA